MVSFASGASPKPLFSTKKLKYKLSTANKVLRSMGLDTKESHTRAMALDPRYNSPFSSNASKVAFHYLIQILKTNDFELLDTQFINDNVLRYGAIEITQNEFKKRLKKGLAKSCVFAMIAS